MKNSISKETGRIIQTTMVNLQEELFHPCNWYGKNRLIDKNEQGEMIFQSVDETAKYYTFFEKNSSFQKLTADSDKIHLSRNNTFKFTGYITGEVKTVIYFIEYAANLERIKTHKIPLNERTIIHKKNQSAFGRIAIRMEGRGSLHIQEMVTSPFIQATFGENTTGCERSMREKKIACILDNRSRNGFNNHATLLNFSQENWESVLLKSKPEFLLVESAWKGNCGTWKGEIQSNVDNKDHYQLKELLLWCRTNDVPTVFWNTEDPFYFHTFKHAASMFDYIFTADMNMIPAYKKLAGHTRVSYLPLAAVSTMYHRSTYQQESDFSGGCHSSEHNIVTIDEQSYIDLEHFSQSAFYGEIFDKIAHGLPVAAKSFPWVKKKFHDIAILSDDESVRQQCIGTLKKDTALYEETAEKGVREIFRYHLYNHRINTVAQFMNIPFILDADDVTLLFVVDNEKTFQRARDIISLQTCPNWKALVILKPFDGYENIFNRYNDEGIYIALGDNIHSRNISEVVSTTFIAVMDPDSTYPPFFLEDMLNAGAAASAIVISAYGANPKKGIMFNRAWLDMFQMNDIINHPRDLIDRMEEQQECVWKGIGNHKLLIPEYKQSAL